jgi:hypothetical protein
LLEIKSYSNLILTIEARQPNPAENLKLTIHSEVEEYGSLPAIQP